MSLVDEKPADYDRLKGSGKRAGKGMRPPPSCFNSSNGKPEEEEIEEEEPIRTRPRTEASGTPSVKILPRPAGLFLEKALSGGGAF